MKRSRRNSGTRALPNRLAANVGAVAIGALIPSMGAAPPDASAATSHFLNGEGAFQWASSKWDSSDSEPPPLSRSPSVGGNHVNDGETEHAEDSAVVH
jgi:hypothetical protein